ncbi:MAG: phage tail tape measure protein, partial [Bacteroidia bacterium]
RFAAQIRKEFAGSLSEASKSVQADVNRLQNAWDQLKQTSSQGLIGDAAVASVKFLTRAVSDMNAEMERTARIGGSWFDNVLARSAGNPVGEALFGKFATGAAADARSRKGDDLLKNRFDPARAGDDARRQNAFPGRDQAVRAAATAGGEWDKLNAKFRTAEQKQADLRKEITDTGTAAGKSAAEIEKLIAAATPKGPAGKKAGKSAEETAFDSFIGTLKSEAATASKAMADLQLEVDTFGLGDQGKQAALIQRLRDQREGLAMVSRSGDADAQQGLSSLTTRIAAEERRLELMREMDSLERQSADRAEAQAATAKIISDAQQSATRVREQVEQLTQENATRGLLKSQIEEMTIARMAERLEMIRAGGGSQEYADKLQQEIEYRKQLRDAMRDKELAGGGGDAMAKQLKDATSAADQFGLTMSSRLEESIIHFKSLGDVVKSVGQDIAQMIIRQNVTKPLAGFISGGLSGLAGMFGGGTAPIVTNGWLSQENDQTGGGWAGMLASMIRAFGGGGRAGGGFVNAGQIHPVAENGPEILYAGGKSYLLGGQNGGMVQPAQGGGGMVVNINTNVDSRVDRAETVRAVKQAVQQSLSQVYDLRSKGQL